MNDKRSNRRRLLTSYAYLDYPCGEKGTEAMLVSEISGKVQTVLGLVAPEDLGVTLPHEHILADLSVYFVEPATATEKHLAYQPITLQNHGWVQRNYMKSLDNSKLTDEETAIDELLLFKRNGGHTIADVTPNCLKRDPLGLARVARVTGLNIIMGTAHYLAMAHPPEMEDWTEQQIAAEFVDEIMIGAGGTGVRAGIIGEIGCSWPLAKNEEKVLRAAAIAQKQTGAPLMIHPGPNESAPFGIIDILSDAGADLAHTIICHISRTLFEPANRLKLAQAGCYLEYDAFGRGPFLYTPAPVDAPTDAQCVDQIRELIAEGYGKQILMSHDICWKIQLTRYGGHGYSYILEYVVPLMRRKGMSEKEIHAILVDNPKNALQFASTK